MTADAIIAALRLQPHPEGGWFAEVWRSAGPGRPAGTSIYFLLKAGEVSHWHRLDAPEIWHFHAGQPLILRQAAEAAGPARAAVLGPDATAGQRPQIVVPAGTWQSARSTGAFTLVGCTMAPGFLFEGFDLAPPGLHIPDAP